MDFPTFARALGGDLRLRGLDVVAIERTDSTNALARRIASQERGSRPVLVAGWEQTRGRGRRGRRWVSSPGHGLFASLLRDGVLPAELGTLPLLAGSAICRELSRSLNRECRLKWPNDVLVAGRKLAGILVETAGGPRSGAVVIGFGINYRNPGPEAGPAATSIQEMAADPPGMAELLARVAVRVLGELELRGEPARATERWAELTVHRPGDRIVCRTPDGLWRGTFDGFDERGALRMRIGGEERLLAAAEVIEG